MVPASPCREFQIGNFANFEQFKVDIHFANFGQVKTVPIRCFTYFGQVTVILLCLGKTCRKKQSKPSPFDKNSRTTYRIWHKLLSKIHSAKTGFLPQSINRLLRFSLLFVSVTCFFYFSSKITYA